MENDKAFSRLKKLNNNYSKLVVSSHEFIDEFISYINTLGLSSFKVDYNESLRVDFSMMGTDFYFEFEFIIPDLLLCDINFHLNSNNRFLYNIKMDSKGNIYLDDAKRKTVMNIETEFNQILDKVYRAYCQHVLAE